jgi:hypothetical protein
MATLGLNKLKTFLLQPWIFSGNLGRAYSILLLAKIFNIRHFLYCDDDGQGFPTSPHLSLSFLLL